MLNFNDTEIAFASKTNQQLKKAYWLFKLVGNARLVSFGKWGTSVALQLGLPIKGIVKKTVYEQFVGGETIDDCEDTIQKMMDYSVHSILDYSVEGMKSETDFEATTHKIIETIEFGAQNKGLPFAVFKVTGLSRFALLEKVSAHQNLTEEERAEFEKTKERVKRICEAAVQHQVALLIDAEESWIQPAIDQMALDMMRTFNQQKACIFNTLQMYRWDRLGYLKELQQLSKKENWHCGLKLVRGAYMEKERERAEELGYKDPIQPNKQASDSDYNAGLEVMIKHLDNMALVAGSHNEESMLVLSELLAKNNFSKNDSRVWFSQLYGMSDHLSFNLAKNGYNVVKYLPFGPIKKTLPYLIRRAEENTSAAGQTSRELLLIQKEMKRRGL